MAMDLNAAPPGLLVLVYGAAAGVGTAVAWPLLVLGVLGLFALSHKSQWASNMYCRLQATGLPSAAARRTAALVMVMYILESVYGQFRPFVAGQHEEPESTPLWWRLAVALCSAATVSACLLVTRGAAMRSDHQNPRIQHRNRLPAHVMMQYFTDPDTAAASAGTGVANELRCVSLNGTWEFELVGSPEAARSTRFFMPATPPSRGTLPVPANWHMHGFGTPIYTNIQYPWLSRWIKPPLVPAQNETGCYRRWFAVPQQWLAEQYRVTLIFHGVEAAFHVWVDGVEVGYSQDSRLPAEFDITPLLIGQMPGSHSNPATEDPERAPLLPDGDRYTQGQHCLAVQCVQFCDGSYLEDQDHWWLAGIHRDVELRAAPSQMRIEDYAVETDLQLSYDIPGEAAQAALDVRVQLHVSGRAYEENDSRIELKLLDRAQPDSVLGVATCLSFQPVARRPEKNVFETETCTDGGIATHEASLCIEIAEPALWSAECPNLYTAVLTLISKGKIIQSEAFRVGFRTSEIKDGLFCINGQPVTICGVNRHEHDDRTGKVVSEDSMLRDIQIMKAHNINACRTAHYPNHPRFYQLADEHGIYIVDEANIESHGDSFFPVMPPMPMSRLPCDPDWAQAYRSRIARMISRDKNHPCVCMWSLGNEAGYGPVFSEMRHWIREHDRQNRPVQYEPCGSPDDCSDIFCPMYPCEAQYSELSRAINDPNENRPIIMCEYAHAMGNSNGSLDEYWEIVRTETQVQGGFIWDWVDQGLRQKERKDSTGSDGRGSTTGGVGNTHWAYGGDFGDRVHDAQFCINGLVFPDRTLHPAMEEVRHLYAPLEVTLLGQRDSSQPVEGWEFDIEVRNLASFTDLSWLHFDWELIDSTGMLATGNLELASPSTRPGSATLAFFKTPSFVRSCQTFLNVNGRSKIGGWLVKATQFKVGDSTAPRLLGSNAASDVESTQQLVTSRDNGSQLFVSCSAGVTVGFCRKRGCVSLLRIDDVVVIASERDGPEHQLWRAPTDNDEAGLNVGIPTWLATLVKKYPNPLWSYAERWRYAGLDSLRLEIKSVIDRLSDDRASFEFTVSGELRPEGHNTAAAIVTTTYTVSLDGTVRVKAEIDCSHAGVPTLARVGMRMRLAASMRNISFFGRGPHENYPDRKQSAHIGLYESDLSEQVVPYIVPGESGGRSDVAWAAATDSDGVGLLVAAPPGEPFALFSALPFSTEQLAAAKHTSELGLDLDSAADSVCDPVYFTLDHAHMGLGGDVGWLPCVHEPFKVEPRTFCYSYTLVPLRPGQRPSAEAATYYAV